MPESNNNGGLLRTVIVTLVTVFVSYVIGFGIYTVSKLDTINTTASAIKERIVILELKVDVLERAMLSRTEDRYTGKDAARDRADIEKRMQTLEKKR